MSMAMWEESIFPFTEVKAPTSTKPMFSLIICIAAPSLGITGPLNLLLFKKHLGPDWSLLLKRFGPLVNFWSLSLLSKLFEYAKTPHGQEGVAKSITWPNVILVTEPASRQPPLWWLRPSVLMLPKASSHIGFEYITGKYLALKLILSCQKHRTQT